MDVSHIKELIPIAGLTERERVVFEAVLEGESYKEIAREFNISVGRARILGKHAILKIYYADKKDKMNVNQPTKLKEIAYEPYRLDVYIDGEVFTTREVKIINYVPRMINTIFRDYPNGVVSHIIVKNPSGIPVKTISYEDWKKDPIGSVKLSESFGGYVHDKDMKKDPKHITGERWRIKFQSTKDLEKHGNTEKSPVDEDRININEIKDIVRTLLKEMWVGWQEGKSSITYKSADDVVSAVSNGEVNREDGFNILMSQFLVPAEVAKRRVNDAIRHYLFQSTQEGINETFDPSYNKPKSKKRYIILGRSGPMTSYYCESPTQGSRMVHNAFSMAKEFETEEEMRNKIKELQQKYKGFKFDFEIVPAGKYQGTRPPKHTISKPTKVEGEWIVKWKINNIPDENKTYYTNDKQDVIDTYASMLKNAEEENQKDS